MANITLGYLSSVGVIGREGDHIIACELGDTVSLVDTAFSLLEVTIPVDSIPGGASGTTS